MEVINAEELFDLPADSQIIDLRRPEDFAKETVPGAVNLYWEDFDVEKAGIQKNLPVYLICYTGEKSGEIGEELSDEGYTVYSVEGGYRAYLRLKLKKLMEDEEALKIKKQAERSIIKTYRKQLWSNFTRAVQDYELIKDGDKVAVCISGGKDSMLMAKLFQELYAHG